MVDQSDQMRAGRLRAERARLRSSAALPRGGARKTNCDAQHSDVPSPAIKRAKAAMVWPVKPGERGPIMSAVISSIYRAYCYARLLEMRRYHRHAGPM